jgi:RNA polymerase sigma factor (sigma-70 family)
LAVEITQAHIDQVNRIAWTLGQTTFGRLAGTDELQSEALVVLWDLATKWDPDKGTTSFHQFVEVNAKRRLIDWLRHAYGGTSTPRRLSISLGVLSLDAIDGLLDEQPADTPAPDEALITADEHAEAADLYEQAMRALPRACSPNQQEVLLRVPDKSPEEIADELGMSRNTVYVHLGRGRQRLRRALTEQSFPVQRTPNMRSTHV